MRCPRTSSCSRAACTSSGTTAAATSWAARGRATEHARRLRDLARRAHLDEIHGQPGARRRPHRRVRRRAGRRAEDRETPGAPTGCTTRARPTSNRTSLGMATSPDGIVWTKDSRSPILERESLGRLLGWSVLLRKRIVAAMARGHRRKQPHQLQVEPRWHRVDRRYAKPSARAERRRECARREPRRRFRVRLPRRKHLPNHVHGLRVEPVRDEWPLRRNLHGQCRGHLPVARLLRSSTRPV